MRAIRIIGLGLAVALFAVYAGCHIDNSSGSSYSGFSSGSSGAGSKNIKVIFNDTKTSDLMSVSLDGSGLTTLANDITGFLISPDQKKVVYQKIDNSLYSISIDGGLAQVLTSTAIQPDAFYITPDSSRVIYILNTTLNVIPINGGDSRVLTDTGEAISEVKISPDSTRAGYLTSDGIGYYDLNIISLNTSFSATITSTNVFNYIISPDSQSVFYQAQPGNELFSAPLAGGGSAKLADECAGLNWRLTPDGAKILYFSSLDTSLKCLTKTGGAPNTLAVDSQNSELIVSPDSRIVCYLTAGSMLMKIPIIGDPALALANNVINPQAAPNGAKIVYYDFTEMNLRTACLCGCASCKTADGYYTSLNPTNFRLTPDSQMVVYLTRDINDIGYLKAVSCAGGVPVTLVSQVEASDHIYCILR